MKFELDRGLVDDKTMKLGLGANTLLRDDEFLFVIVEDPKDPLWSTYACLSRLLAHLPPDWKQHIFLSKAPEKVLKVRRKKNDKSEAWWDPIDDKKGGTKPAGKLGKNKPTAMFRSLAERCGFDNPQRFTSRAARRTGISKMGKAGVNQHLINQKARHADTSTNKLYNDPHETSLAAAAVALHYEGNEEKTSFSTIDVKENFLTQKKKSGLEILVEDDLVLQAPEPAPVVPVPAFAPQKALVVLPAPVAPVVSTTMPASSAPPAPGWYYQHPPPLAADCQTILQGYQPPPPPGYHQVAPPPTGYHPPLPQAPPAPAPYGYQYAPAPAVQPSYPSYGYAATAGAYPPPGAPTYAPPPPQTYPPTYAYPPAEAPPAYHHPHPPPHYSAPQHNMPWPTPSVAPSHPPTAPQPHHPMYYQHPHGN